MALVAGELICVKGCHVIRREFCFFGYFFIVNGDALACETDPPWHVKLFV
jgi:hypothetical protein